MDPYGIGASFGLLALERGVRAYFDANTISASVAFGWTERYRKDNQGPGSANRVTLMPGRFDPSTGEPKAIPAGRLDRAAAADFVETDEFSQRVLAWLHEDVSVSVWAANPDVPKDPRESYGAITRLRMLTIQALHNAVDPQTSVGAGFGNIEDWGDTTWSLPPGEAAFGREFMFGLVLRVPMLDAPVRLAFPQPVIERAAS